jgi:hypothetical protein
MVLPVWIEHTTSPYQGPDWRGLTSHLVFVFGVDEDRVPGFFSGQGVDGGREMGYVDVRIPQDHAELVRKL